MIEAIDQEGIIASQAKIIEELRKEVARLEDRLEDMGYEVLEAQER